MKIKSAIMRIALTVLSICATDVALADNVSLPVPLVTIYPGDAIEPNMLGEVLFKSLGRVPIIRHRDDLIGKVARRTLLPRRPVAKNAVQDRPLVTRSSRVVAYYRSGGMTITAELTAMRDGRLGDTIQARNPETGVMISARVQADGTLLVSRP